MGPDEIHDGDYFKSTCDYRNGADVRVKSVYISKNGPKMVDYEYVLNGEVILNTHAGIIWFCQDLLSAKGFIKITTG